MRFDELDLEVLNSYQLLSRWHEKTCSLQLLSWLFMFVQLEFVFTTTREKKRNSSYRTTKKVDDVFLAQLIKLFSFAKNE